jgi:hypothetical protein
MSPRLALVSLACLSLVACKDDDGGDDTTTTVATPATFTSDPDPGSSGGPTTEASQTSEIDSAEATSDEPTTDAPTTLGTSATTSTATTDDDPTTDGTTEPAPTDGPGVLPGETGLDAFCRRYVECGGAYYADAQACIDESLGYWGECPSRRAALDAFGACMSEIECADWNPDAYNPGSTPCAEQWGDLGASDPCN